MREQPGAHFHSDPAARGSARTPGDTGFHLSFESGDLATRDALKSVVGNLHSRGLGGELVGSVELVLAEILNNISEHAYADRPTGPVDLRMSVSGGLLRVEIVDQGIPLPDTGLPGMGDADVPAETAELPEGGFGWFLIHQLTESLQYRRDTGRNRLTVTFACT
ncbi:ATP-binding protein [Mesobacterium pallidum]|uniref:ATP-binding protein n=1 Tax=Mesobacterium pallidum TaxID=2872037 RepID=UPI001EE232E5